MPFKIRCSNCGYLFYHGSNLEALEIILKPKDECPECHKKIEKDPKKIRYKIEIPGELEG
jgi:rRNA maturation endonuclease Nob1